MQLCPTPYLSLIAMAFLSPFQPVCMSMETLSLSPPICLLLSSDYFLERMGLSEERSKLDSEMIVLTVVITGAVMAAH